MKEKFIRYMEKEKAKAEQKEAHRQKELKNVVRSMEGLRLRRSFYNGIFAHFKVDNSFAEEDEKEHAALRLQYSKLVS